MSRAHPLDNFSFRPEFSSFRANSPIHESECDFMRILVVDDDKVFCQLLVELLESRGYEVDWTSRALKAFKMSQRNYYELFVIDARMPIIPGTQLAEELKEQFPGAKIILISAFADKSLKNQATELGIPLLCKPFVNEAFLDLVAKLATPSPRNH